MAFRAFVAVPVPAEPALTRLLEELAALDAHVKPVDAGHLHFTLSFLGDVPDDAVDTLANALRAGVAGKRAFDVDLRTVGAFPSARRPRVVWVGVADPRPMVDLALGVREALAAAGYPGDAKDFRAHLTLARVKSERGLHELVRWLREHGPDELGAMRVSEARLFRSRLSPTGPSYDTLASAPLEA